MKIISNLVLTMMLTYAIADLSFDNPKKNIALYSSKNQIELAQAYNISGQSIINYLISDFFKFKKNDKKYTAIKIKKQNITLKEYLQEKYYPFMDKRYKTILEKPENKKIMEELTNKKIPIFMFHRIDYTNNRYSLAPDEFKIILETLWKNNYYAINLEEFIKNDLSKVPVNKKPYLITFDDAHKTQFRYIPGTDKIDPESAIGILEDFFKEHSDAGKGAVFYQSAFGVGKKFIYFFGNRKNAKKKEDYLLTRGYDIGSHTTTHINLRKASLKKVEEEILTIDALLEMETTKNYLKEAKEKKLRTLARPYGAKEKDPAVKKFLREKYDAIFNATGGRTHLAKTKKFNPYQISRIEANTNTVNHIIKKESNQFVQTKKTKEFFEDVYNYNPTISIDSNDLVAK